MAEMAERLSNQLSNADFNSLKRVLLEWIANNPQKKLSFLLTGKTGVGKSRLVNALVGEDVADEGQQRDSCTNTATPYKVTKEDIDILVWDSPGLQDGNDDCSNWYLENLKDINSRYGIDVVIYCLKMDDRRFYSEDKKAIRKLTEGFGKELWKKTVIALTFANKIQDPDEIDHDIYFLKEFTEWERQLRGVPSGILTELQIDSQVLSALPIIPVGNYAGRPKKPKPLPNGDHWLSELWISCYSVMSDTAGIALYKISKNRLVFGAPAVASIAARDDPRDTNIQGDIPLTDRQQNTLWKRMWQAFKRVAPTLMAFSVNTGAIAAVGIAILKALSR